MGLETPARLVSKNSSTDISYLTLSISIFSACVEAYSSPQDRFACNTGCEFMAKERVSELVSLFSVAIYVEEGPDSSILLMSPDMPESDILTDPGLRKELLPGWWDSEGFKLPQTYIKTVPIDSGVRNEPEKKDVFFFLLIK